MKTTAEMIAVMQAHLDGKEIEYWDNYPPTWKIATKPSWDWRTTDYRIKPEHEYIPFTFDDVEFLIGKVVKHKTKPNVEKLISFGNESANAIFYNELLENYTFLDGSPCGKLKSK